MTSVQSQNLLRQAVARQRAGALDQATALYRRAAALSPGDPLCARALAQALAAGGAYPEAEKVLRVVVSRAPACAEAWDELAVALQHVGKPAEATAASRRAVTVNPRLLSGWLNLGLALLNTGNPAESLGCQDQAIALDPGCAAAHHGRGMALQHLCRIPEAIGAYGEAIRLNPARMDTRSYRLLALHYVNGVSRETLWREHLAFAGALKVAAASPPLPTRGSGETPLLRVGFLSPDLREHSVAYFLEPLLRHLGREGIEVYLYHDHYAVDAVSERLKGHAAGWRQLVGLRDAQAGAVIRADRLDALIELAGHTGLNRLPLLASRVAPVQISYLGYPDTTGLSAIDYRFVDQRTDPVGEADAYHSERLVRFAPTMWAYDPPHDAPPLAIRRPDRPVTFGSCNNLAKLSDETLFNWGGLLAAAPQARLLVKSAGLEAPGAADQFRTRAAALGVDAARLEVVGRIADQRGHLGFYDRIDIALDPYPYHGTTTTCEALWMGVPVVSLQGDRHCSRVGASLLAAIGRPEWVAQSWDGYRDAALTLAANLPDRGVVRALIAGSALLDHAGQATRFAAALRRCWAGLAGTEEAAA